MVKHAFGDVVLYQRGKETVNALVVQTVSQPDGEHLTVVYLDPTMASPLLSGMNVEKAIATAFVTPLTGGKTYGWRELPTPPKGFGQAAYEALVYSQKGPDTPAAENQALPSAADIDAAVAEQKAADATTAADAVFGPVTPGDPESPHAIEPADPTEPKQD
jgi:hypothetical protein